MTVRLTEVVSFLDTTLDIESFRDYGPNGLQVEGSPEVDKVVTGVSASAELFRRAAEADADLVVVHHGLIWGGGIPRVVGATANRLRILLENRVSLAAYHLPLDKHPRLGNNVGMADAIALTGSRDSFGDIRGHSLGLEGAWADAVTRDEAVARIAAGICGGRTPQFVFPHGPDVVRKVGLCSGAASDLLEASAARGCDLFVTGELAERSAELARELQITLVAAGHYSTEVFGAKRLVEEMRMKFPGLNVEFLDVPTTL